MIPVTRRFAGRRRGRRPYSAGSAQDDDAGAHAHAAVEVDYIRIRHPDAARGHRLADRVRLVRAVDAVQRAAEIHRAGAERVGDAALHVAREVRPALQHLGRRRPVRPLGLARDGLRPGPLEPRAADPDAVADRAAVAEHVVEPALGGRDHDRARRIAAEGDDLARDRRYLNVRARLVTVVLLPLLLRLE